MTDHDRRPSGRFPSLLLGLGLTCASFMTVAHATENASVREQGPPAKLDPVSYYRDLRKARDLMARHSWEEAAKLYESLVAHNPADGALWRDLGDCRYARREYLRAADAFEKALAIGFDFPADGTYLIACCRALADDKEGAFSWLEKSLAGKFEERPDIARDERFRSLRDDPRFPELVGRLDHEVDRDEGWSLDLAFLVKEVKRLHDKFSKQPLPRSFEQGVIDLEERIASFSDPRMAIEIQKLLALLGDGHTVLYPLPGKLGTLTYLPIRFYLFADGLFVIDAGLELQRWIGARVVQIGETEVGDAMRRVESIVSHDNPMGIKWIGPVYLTFPDVLEALGIVERASRVAVVFETRDGRRETAVLENAAPLTSPSLPKLIPSKIPGAPPPPLYLSKVADHYWFQHFAELATVYFQFNHVNDKRDETLDRFLTRLTSLLEEKSVKSLIVDMRNNEGGNGFLAAVVARALIRFESAGDDRRIFVMTSRNTFSAAQMVINWIDLFTSAIFVGEPSSSRPNFTGEDTTLLLPYSGLRGSISSRSHQTDARDHRFWIAPEIPVELSSQDYFANRDPALDALLTIIGQPPR